MIAFIFFYSIDSLACNDCIPLFENRGVNPDKYQCSICLNIVEGVDSDGYRSLLSAAPFTHQAIFVSYFEPVFQVNKPPS